MLDLKQARTGYPPANATAFIQGQDQSVGVVVEQHNIEALLSRQCVFKDQIRSKPKCPFALVIVDSLGMKCSEHVAVSGRNIEDLNPVRDMPSTVWGAVPRGGQLQVNVAIRVMNFIHFQMPTFALPPQGGGSPQATVGECRGWNRQAEAWRRCHDLN